MHYHTDRLMGTLIQAPPCSSHPIYNSLISLVRVSSGHRLYFCILGYEPSLEQPSHLSSPPPHTHTMLYFYKHHRHHGTLILRDQLLLTLWWFLLRLLFTALHCRPRGVGVTFINSECAGSSSLRQFTSISWEASRGRWGAPFHSGSISQAEELTQSKSRSQNLLENGFWLPRPCPVSKGSECSGISYCKYSKSS